MTDYYKPFSQQMWECAENGTQGHEYCIHCSKIVITCKKYGGQCMSRKCLKERIVLKSSEG